LPPSLFWRVFLLNAALLVAAAVTLAFTPATISFPVRPHQLVVLGVGLVVVLAANALLLRVSLAPLRGLAELMRRVDLLVPGQRLEEEGARELRAVIETFNQMIDRLEVDLGVSDDGRLAMTIADDGRGIAHGVDREGGGIRGMRERALAVDARLEIRSRPGGGARVTVSAGFGRR
jgi:two-component system sensor histidine kinase UhpB